MVSNNSKNEFQMNNANGANQQGDPATVANASGTNPNQQVDEANRLAEEAAKAEADRIAKEKAGADKVAADKAAADLKAEEEAEAKAKADAEAQEPTDGEVKHSITYIGNGVWTDSIGQKWSREATKTTINHKVFTDDELKERKDILFMIDYKSMRKVTVE